MDLGLSQEQKMLAEEARKFLSKEWNATRVREVSCSETGHDKGLWDKMAALGWLGIIIPEAYGGLGLGLTELALLYEECGRALIPTSFYSTITAALAILQGGDESRKQDCLPRIVEGSLRMSLAISEPQAIHDPAFFQTAAVFVRGDYTLRGTKLFVPDALSADELIVAARISPTRKLAGVTLFLIEKDAPGLQFTPLQTFGGEKQYEIRLDSVRVNPKRILGTPDEGWAIVQTTLDQATALQCAEMVGGAQRVMEMTVQYMNDRYQFDRPIGSFQAVQHACADMSIEVDASRELTYQAISLIDEGLPARKEISMAKAWAGETYKHVTLTAHHLFGGIGFSREHDLYLYSSRAKAAELSLGPGHHHLEVVADHLGI